MRRTAAALAAAVLLALTPGAAHAAGSTPSPAPLAALGIRLTEIPASEQNDPRARLYVIDHVAPGATITRRIEVSNTGDPLLPARLYSAGASISGGTFLGAPGHTADSLSSWTSVAPGSIDVPGHSAVGASVTIAVPGDAAPGEHYAVIWAETGGPAAGVAGGVAVVNRVGIRIYLSVGPGGAPEAAFTIDSMTAERDSTGRPVVIASVHNSGGRALDMSGTLRLGGGPAGLSAGPFPAELGTTLAPGDTEPVTFTLDERLPAGPWDAVITLRSGEVEETATATISFPTAGVSPAVPAVGLLDHTGWLLAVLAVLVLVTLLIFWARHRARRRVPA